MAVTKNPIQRERNTMIDVRERCEAALRLPYRLSRKLLSLTLSRLEILLLAKADKAQNYPLVFIIGAPRTGSTVLYQYITQYLSVAYINNFMCKWKHAMYLASIFSRMIFHDKPHNTFSSKEGRTTGWNGPSECGGFWYRWFPRGRHFVDFGEVSAAQAQEMCDVVTAISNVYKKPIVFKNMNCGQRLRALKSIFPNALFIYCKRDPVYVAQSILRTRERVYGTRKKWWSIMPKEYEELLRLDPVEQVVKQVYYIQKQIEQDRKLFSPDQFIEVWYEEFCRFPWKVIERIRSFISHDGLSVKYRIPIPEESLNISEKQNLDDLTFNKLTNIINSLEW